MEQSKPTAFYQRAMRYGTYLGIIWAIMYIMVFNSLRIPFLGTAASVLFICSPFIAKRFATRYRDEEYGSGMAFPQAWTFLFCTYLFATLLSTFTNYIYLEFFDQGAFQMDAINIYAEVLKTPGIDEAAREQIKAIQEMISQMSVRSMTISLMNSNIFSSLVLPPVIALFVKKKQQL